MRSGLAAGAMADFLVALAQHQAHFSRGLARAQSDARQAGSAKGSGYLATPVLGTCIRDED